MWNRNQKTAEHFFLRCHFYITQRLQLFKKIDSNFFNSNEKDQVNTLLHVPKQMILHVLIKKFLNL